MQTSLALGGEQFMDHGPYCDCLICSVSKMIGTLETPKNEHGHLCECGSGLKHEKCCGRELSGRELETLIKKSF